MLLLLRWAIPDIPSGNVNYVSSATIHMSWVGNKFYHMGTCETQNTMKNRDKRPDKILQNFNWIFMHYNEENLKVETVLVYA